MHNRRDAGLGLTYRHGLYKMRTDSGMPINKEEIVANMSEVQAVDLVRHSTDRPEGSDR